MPCNHDKCLQQTVSCVFLPKPVTITHVFGQNFVLATKCINLNLFEFVRLICFPSTKWQTICHFVDGKLSLSLYPCDFSLNVMIITCASQCKSSFWNLIFLESQKMLFSSMGGNGNFFILVTDSLIHSFNSAKERRALALEVTVKMIINLWYVMVTSSPCCRMNRKYCIFILNREILYKRTSLLQNFTLC